MGQSSLMAPPICAPAASLGAESTPHFIRTIYLSGECSLRWATRYGESVGGPPPPHAPRARIYSFAKNGWEIWPYRLATLGSGQGKFTRVDPVGTVTLTNVTSLVRI